MAIETDTTLESYFEFHDDGAIWIRGHRVGIDLLLEAYKGGQSPEQIAEQFDTIRLEDVYATITYYLRNKSRLYAWLAEIEESFKRQIEASDLHPAPVVQRLRERVGAGKRGELLKNSKRKAAVSQKPHKCFNLAFV